MNKTEHSFNHKAAAVYVFRVIFPIFVHQH
jgi:hypothetical protein